ncbi:MAG: alpha/beta fold hydrolase [Polaromonas sp.]|uniref:alpha/beta hydrolase n=1 Tax=Polaromonas sp. TaxID=1869339 RepID=UPI00273220CD|nr:alpha/beta fold hydrolase [Polaromonas sp.]MDP1742833.1 alpha/beta fold hydrolase [Polaromonas sp.]MDP1955944.1 alpha/beta fold hydrolase [Polaromonas sp.]MDP3357157.1 alpha/beta fold hydrolase [Polaromonas sp.]MDP3752833.1 alpha/beta fold hydrolase [Polaromonas sp.]
MTRSSLEATAAFYNTSPMTRLFRWGLGASQRLWPALAVRAAYRLFGTPLPPRWLARRRAWPTDWTITAWPFETASITLYTRPVAPHGPVVLLVHGWGGHAGQMLALADSLQAQGLRAVILEMPAHGRSAGPTSNLPQFARAITYAAARLQQQGFSVDAVVAHSLGANAAAFAASRGLALRKLVLLAPPASPYEYTRLFAQVFGLSERTRAAVQKRLEAREGILMPQFEPKVVGPRISQATLVVHDRRDSINHFADGVAFSEAIASARLLATQDLGHRRILKDPEVLRQITEFVT